MYAILTTETNQNHRITFESAEIFTWTQIVELVEIAKEFIDSIAETSETDRSGGSKGESKYEHGF